MDFKNEGLMGLILVKFLLILNFLFSLFLSVLLKYISTRLIKIFAIYDKFLF